jgi:hypothetical protein
MATSSVWPEGRSELAYQRNELDAALRLVTDGIADSRQLNYPVPLAWGWPPWRGSGTPAVTRWVPWKRWATPNGWRQGRPWLT